MLVVFKLMVLRIKLDSQTDNILPGILLDSTGNQLWSLSDEFNINIQNEIGLYRHMSRW